MPKSFIDTVQNSPRTGIGIPVKTKKKPSFEPKHRPRNHLSASNFTGGWFQLKVAYDSSVIRSLRTPTAATRPLCKPTSRACQGRNKEIPPQNDADSKVHPRRRTAGAGPDAISTGPSRCFAPDAHRALSSSSHV